MYSTIKIMNICCLNVGYKVHFKFLAAYYTSTATTAMATINSQTVSVIYDLTGKTPFNYQAFPFSQSPLIAFLEPFAWCGEFSSAMVEVLLSGRQSDTPMQTVECSSCQSLRVCCWRHTISNVLQCQRLNRKKSLFL